MEAGVFSILCGLAMEIRRMQDEKTFSDIQDIFEQANQILTKNNFPTIDFTSSELSTVQQAQHLMHRFLEASGERNNEYNDEIPKLKADILHITEMIRQEEDKLATCLDQIHNFESDEKNIRRETEHIERTAAASQRVLQNELNYLIQKESFVYYKARLMQMEYEALPEKAQKLSKNKYPGSIEMSSFLPPQPPTENENVFQQTASSLELLRARLEEESQSLQTTIQEEEDTLKTLLSSSSLSQQDLSTLFPQHYETQMLSITNVDELVEKVLVLQDNVEAAIQTAQTLDSLDVSGLIETLNSFDELAKQQRLLIEQSASMSSTSEPLQNTSFSMSFDEALAGLIGEFQTHAEKDRNTFQSLLTQLRREQAFFEREQAEFDSWSAELNAS